MWLGGGNVFGKVFLHQQTHQKYLTSLFFQLAIECYNESHLIHHLQKKTIFLVMTLPTITASTEQLSSNAKAMLTNTTNSHYFNITKIHHIFMHCLKTSTVLIICSHKPFWKTSNAKTVQTSPTHCMHTLGLFLLAHFTAHQPAEFKASPINHSQLQFSHFCQWFILEY